jgi:hypothetical protein
VQSDPRSVAEVRRILLLHLATACPKGCMPGAITVGQPSTSLPPPATSPFREAPARGRPGPELGPGP